jgi:hypothetical protein
MRIEKDKCEECGYETEDRYIEKGWIQFELKSFTISKGRRKNRSVLYRHNLMLDFCGKKCFRSYFDNLIIADK